MRVLAASGLLLAACHAPAHDAEMPSTAVAGAGGTAAASTPPVPGANRQAAAPAEDGADGLDAIKGTWRVTAVRIGQDGVQAIMPNDPADMGAVLDVARDRLSWRPHDGGTFTDTCSGPRMTLDGQISCREGAFGPPGARLLKTADTLTLDWYDGATLVLSRS